MGTVAFALVLDFRIVRPTTIEWMFHYHSDPPQYYLALAYYRNSAWHFPLDRMETMLHPAGASFMVADGMPLLGIPTKALAWALPTDFQYYGFWLLVCYVLNAVFAKQVLNSLVRSTALQWAGVAVITLAPAFVANFRHAHLSSHWLLLAAFHAVIAAPALPKRRIWLYSTLALFIQPYLFVMVSGVLVGAFWVHRRARRDAVISAIVWVSLILLSAWVLGYFSMGKATASIANRYHADLTAFVSAMGTSSIVPDTPIGGPFKRSWNGTAGTFAYLGLGGLVLFAALIACLVQAATRRSSAPALDPAWKVLGALCLLMAAYAWTPSPYILGTRYSGLPFLTEIIQPIVARLRTVLRFQWPLYYFVLCFGLQAADHWLARLSTARAATIGAALLACAQFADIGPWLVSRDSLLHLDDSKRVGKVSRAVKAALTKRTRYLVLDPPVSRHDCGWVGLPASKRRWKREDYYPLALFGARHGLIANTDFLASGRSDSKVVRAVCLYTAEIRAMAKRPKDVLFVQLADGSSTARDDIGEPSGPKRRKRKQKSRHLASDTGQVRGAGTRRSDD